MIKKILWSLFDFADLYLDGRKIMNKQLEFDYDDEKITTEEDRREIVKAASNQIRNLPRVNPKETVQEAMDIVQEVQAKIDGKKGSKKRWFEQASKVPDEPTKELLSTIKKNNEKPIEPYEGVGYVEEVSAEVQKVIDTIGKGPPEELKKFIDNYFEENLYKKYEKPYTKEQLDKFDKNLCLELYKGNLGEKWDADADASEFADGLLYINDILRINKSIKVKQEELKEKNEKWSEFHSLLQDRQKEIMSGKEIENTEFDKPKKDFEEYLDEVLAKGPENLVLKKLKVSKKLWKNFDSRYSQIKLSHLVYKEKIKEAENTSLKSYQKNHLGSFEGAVEDFLRTERELIILDKIKNTVLENFKNSDLEIVDLTKMMEEIGAAEPLTHLLDSALDISDVISKDKAERIDAYKKYVKGYSRTAPIVGNTDYEGLKKQKLLEEEKDAKDRKQAEINIELLREKQHRATERVQNGEGPIRRPKPEDLTEKDKEEYNNFAAKKKVQEQIYCIESAIRGLKYNIRNQTEGLPYCDNPEANKRYIDKDNKELHTWNEIKDYLESKSSKLLEQKELAEFIGDKWHDIKDKGSDAFIKEYEDRKEFMEENLGKIYDLDKHDLSDEAGRKEFAEELYKENREESEKELEKMHEKSYKAFAEQIMERRKRTLENITTGKYGFFRKPELKSYSEKVIDKVEEKLQEKLDCDYEEFDKLYREKFDEISQKYNFTVKQDLIDFRKEVRLTESGSDKVLLEKILCVAEGVFEEEENKKKEKVEILVKKLKSLENRYDLSTEKGCDQFAQEFFLGDWVEYDLPEQKDLDIDDINISSNVDIDLSSKEGRQEYREKLKEKKYEEKIYDLDKPKILNPCKSNPDKECTCSCGDSADSCN